MITISASPRAFDTSSLSRPVANARGVSGALLRYQTDNSYLPGGGLQPVRSIASLMSSVSGKLPTEDGWGNALYYEMVTVSGLPRFRVYSYGKDDTPDGVITGNDVDFFTDVVIEGGTFIQTKWDQWPHARTSRHERSS